MEWKMEWKGNLVIEYGRCQNGMEWKISRMEWNGRFQEWNGMEDFKNGMEDNFPYFHTNAIIDFVLCICRKIHTDFGW